MDRTLWWDGPADRLRLIDQTLIPARYESVLIPDVDALVEAIRSLRVRGAPALGVAGAYGVALAARTAGPGGYLENVGELAKRVRSARPTAVNLAWGVDRALAAIGEAEEPGRGRRRDPRRGRTDARTRISRRTGRSAPAARPSSPTTRPC